MAKKPNEPSNDNATPLTTPKPTGDALAVGGHDELAGLTLGDGMLDNDGLGEANRDDIRIPMLVINYKGTDKTTGRSVAPDVFFNTVDEVVKQDVDAVLVLLRKTRLYSVYNEAEKKSDVICRSTDNVRGVMNTGVIRPCEGCPDNEWSTKPDGKRTRHCTPVYNVFGVDREAGQLFVMRFKKTSLPVFKAHMQKYHLGRRQLPGGKRVNYPLFVFSVKLSAKMAGPKATHAVPVIERTGVLTEDEIRMYADTLQTLTAQTEAVIDKADAGGGDGGSDPSDASFEYGGNAANDKYAGDTGNDFVGGGGSGTVQP